MIPLILGLLLAAPFSEIAHSVRIDHPAGPVHTDYRAQIDIRHQQLGVAAPGGRASTLRCRWQADLVVDRQARHAAGTLQRELRQEAVASGSRPGWCTANRAAITKDVASATKDMRGAVEALAARDAEMLRAELDQIGRVNT
ncbi:hypothetical protein [Sphingomonas sp. TDK1]|uniref:hypothetical protein n=1 Tax=Sphingomonas sp. TDK1 TaxID=453247 RepID=UPI0007D9F67E|nr:hypothetical protein [Sphingomonas sp. TDK1]OAN66948.1 hypothetical protein A7X12_10035 [Sphingomonas sp. TDK1]